MARILIIDDDRDVRALYGLMLEREGHLVLDAGDAGTRGCGSSRRRGLIW